MGNVPCDVDQSHRRAGSDVYRSADGTIEKRHQCIGNVGRMQDVPLLKAVCHGELAPRKQAAD